MNEHRNRQAVWMLLFFAVALSSTTAAFAATPAPEAAKADILGTYNFEPSKMTFDQQASHAPGLSELRRNRGQTTVSIIPRTNPQTPPHSA